MFTKIDKALVAFILAAAGVLGSGQVAGDSNGSVTLISALVVGLVAALGVWAAPNKA